MSLEKCIVDECKRIVIWSAGTPDEVFQKYLDEHEEWKVAFYDTDLCELVGV